MNLFHNDIVGHHGVDTTIRRIKQNHKDWPGMWNHTKKFIRECPICQKLKYNNPNVKTQPFTSSVYSPMVRIDIDTIGPIPNPETDGDRYVLVIIDCFSRFIELYATKTVDSKECAAKLLNFIGRYGTPEVILSDKGSQFVNELIDSLIKLIGSKRQLSIAYSKQENSIVERANREIMRHLRAMILTRSITDDWPLFLPLVQRIMNASVHSSLGVSPAQLIYGDSIDLDRSLLPIGEENIIPPNLSMDTHDYMKKLINKQKELLSFARGNQLKTDNAHLKSKEVDASKLTSFPVDSLVLCSYPEVLGGKPRPPTKLHSYWEGPFRVINNVGDKYSIENLTTKVIKDVHVTRLKQFVFDPKQTDPTRIAAADKGMFIVEKVLGHQGNTKKSSTLKFLIHWLGYPNEDDSWEPWSNMRDNSAVHEYLISKGLEKLIPKKFLKTN